MKIHTCRCQFIPPHVMENLAKAGREQARVSVHQDMSWREKRAARAVDVKTFAGMAAAPTGKAQRLIYDCKEQWQQRVELVRSEGGPVTPDEDVTLGYDYLGVVRDYLKAMLGRDSVDNSSMDLIFNVHYGQKYLNAFWDGDEMTFGDGDDVLFTSFAKSLDVVAHELFHGVTQFAAGLKYYGQSGALNESFSDVFGTAITQHYLKQTADNADWLIGDEIMGPDLYGESLRSMKMPGTAYDNPLMGKDNQPAHMKDYYTGNADNQGVHINSGIPNRAFYLTAREIGTDKAALIWYNALQRLWPWAKFNDAVAVIVEAARILVKAGQVNKGAAQTVRLAFKEVGLPHV